MACGHDKPVLVAVGDQLELNLLTCQFWAPPAVLAIRTVLCPGFRRCRHGAHSVVSEFVAQPESYLNVEA